MGYTRYGAWYGGLYYGSEYSDWDSMFVAFCLDYAGVAEELTYNSGAFAWSVELAELGYYQTADAYTPEVGDVAFIDTDLDGRADVTAIVVAVDETITVIQGNYAVSDTESGETIDTVALIEYPTGDSILGYANVTYTVEEAEDEEITLDESDEIIIEEIEELDVSAEDFATLEFVGTDYIITVSYGEDAALPEGTELVAYEYAQDSENFLARYAEAAELYGWSDFDETDPYHGFRLFNIGLYYEGIEIEPAASVTVTVTYTGEGVDMDSVYVTHFTDTSTEPLPATVETTEDTQSVTFTSDSFSEFGIMMASEETEEIEEQGIVLLASTAYSSITVGTETYTVYTVDDFYLFTFSSSSSTTNLGPTTWTQGVGFTDAITDVLTYAIDDTNYYLVPISYFESLLGSYGYGFTETYTAWCPIKYAENADSPTAITGYASYVQVDGNWYVQVVDSKAGNYTSDTGIPRSNVYLDVYIITDTISPSGTVINLFDYWTVTQDAVDVGVNYDTGINADHTLKFAYNPGQWTVSSANDYNKWTGSSAVRSGMVEKLLSNGYPILDDDMVGSANVESLEYLFSTSYAQNGKASYRNVQNLLQVDEDGYYSYNCATNYAQYDEDSNSFILYSEPAVASGQFFPFDTYEEAADLTTAEASVLNHYFGMSITTRFVQQNGGYTSPSQTTATTFEFSGDDDVWIFIDNVLVADLGGIHSAASVTINFATGDVTINGAVTNTLKSAYEAAGVDDKYDWAEVTDDSGSVVGYTYDNGTYHTLKFYYLERGNSASNLLLKFNLTEIPETSISKINQYGEAIEGAGFAVYSATKDADGNYWYLYDSYDETTAPDDKELATVVSDKIDARTYTIDSNGNICDSSGSVLITAKYVGTTDANGEMEFVDDDLLPYSLPELEELFGTYFIAREISVPKGYRIISEDIYLRIVDSRVLDCDNTYESGVYAATTELITATNEITTTNGDTYTYYDPSATSGDGVNGTLFAVVMKYVGNGDASTDDDPTHWAPVYGSDESGYTVMSDSSYTNETIITAAIEAAQQMENNGYSDSVFELGTTSGAMQVLLTALPGDIGTYYYLLDDNEKSNTQYTVAIYYTTEDSLSAATSSNTYRIDATSFTRIFGASIQVPNLSNMLLVQKLDVYGNLVNGARFALYEVSEESDGKIYYVADDSTLIYLEADTDGDNKGVAYVKDAPGTTGTYTISSTEDSTEGVITVEIDGTTYTITPKEVETTVAKGDQTSAYTGFKYTTDEDGTAVFDNLEEEIGTYYIREISAPSGYLLNTTEVMVLVTSSTVYANAGTPYDGVSVARSAGYIVSTLDQMAVIGDIDNTLSWIYTTLQVNTGESETFNFTEFVENANSLWNASADHAYLEYDGTLNSTINDYAVNTARSSADGYINNAKLTTDEGWSYLQIFQDTAYHQARVTSGADVSYAYTTITTPITSLYSRSVYVQVTDQFVQVELPETGGVSLPVAYAVGSLMIIVATTLLLRRRAKISKKQNCQT
ncbi:MAG: hypothetical protein LUG23_07860 [Oscillospiraceae bacterium]|nr:hypothetical protein [Oscillospiraceae bacterium]